MYRAWRVSQAFHVVTGQPHRPPQALGGGCRRAGGSASAKAFICARGKAVARATDLKWWLGRQDARYPGAPPPFAVDGELDQMTAMAITARAMLMPSARMICDSTTPMGSRARGVGLLSSIHALAVLIGLLLTVPTPNACPRSATMRDFLLRAT
jgi:hypothetical protein